jgi:hypothetical protein
MSSLQIAWRATVSVLNNKYFSMNLFRFQQFETYQRRSLAPVRYTACAFKK